MLCRLTHQISRQSSSQPNCRRRRQSQTISIKSGQSHNIGDGKLIEKERVETGRVSLWIDESNEFINQNQVKMSVYLEYMRAAGFILSFLFIFLFLANQGMQIGRNFWLSVWADENEQANLDLNETIGGQSDDEFRLAIYGVFGIFEGRNMADIHQIYPLFPKPSSFSFPLLPFNLAHNSVPGICIPQCSSELCKLQWLFSIPLQLVDF